MLTKDECEKALKALYDENDEMEDYAATFSFDDDYIPQCVYEAAKKHCYDTLKRLIQEHFDNPPLSFEELKPGMWVWDIQIRGYKKICYLDGEMKKLNFALWGIDWIEFEPNRFYRKQKED